MSDMLQLVVEVPRIQLPGESSGPNDKLKHIGHSLTNSDKLNAARVTTN